MANVRAEIVAAADAIVDNDQKVDEEISRPLFLFVAKLARINEVQTITIAIETGIQNSTVAITVALTILNNNKMSVIPGLYAIWMYVTGFAPAFWIARRAPAAAAEQAAA